MAVFGPGIEDGASGRRGLFEPHDRLAEWLAARGQELSYTPDGLEQVDRAVEEWRLDPAIFPAMGNEIGTYLGSVLVGLVDGAEWHVWPNGHPIVRVPPNHEIDAVALAGRRVMSGQPSLMTVLRDALGWLE